MAKWLFGYCYQWRFLHPGDRYKGLDYPPASGSADYITVTLTGSDGTTRYADIIQGQLPDELQKVTEAWNKITSRYLVAP